jgi:hypothetical protein
MTRIITIPFLLFFLLIGINEIKAQVKPVNKKQTTPPAMNVKPPKLKTFLGILSDTMTIPVDQAKAVMGTSLRVVDENNNILKVTYYQMMYRKRVISEDDVSGKQYAALKLLSEDFTVTPLPGSWVRTITEELSSGEEILFFDIIAKDAKGLPFYAPNLKIIIK